MKAKPNYTELAYTLLKTGKALDMEYIPLKQRERYARLLDVVQRYQDSTREVKEALAGMYGLSPQSVDGEVTAEAWGVLESLLDKTQEPEAHTIYRIQHRPTGEWATTVATNATDACRKMQWMIGDCYVRAEANPMAQQILQRTHDGDELAGEDLLLLQQAVNHHLTRTAADAFLTLLGVVQAGKYDPAYPVVAGPTATLMKRFFVAKDSTSIQEVLTPPRKEADKCQRS